MVTFEKQLRKNTWYPRPHSFAKMWGHGVEDAGATQTTILPLTMYDEGLGSPSGYNAHPEHASFAETTMPNCYANSKINKIACNMYLSLTKGALETDKIHALRVAYMVVALSFKDNYTAIDEVSTNEVQDVLEYQTEDTDRQGYPLYNGTKMKEPYTNSALLHTNVPGLTTNQKIEAVDFSAETFYDMQHYSTIAGKIHNSQYGLKWLTLTRHNPTKHIRINIKSKAKRLNPYTALGLLVYVPQVDSTSQIPVSTETTDIEHVRVLTRTRYSEWNENFDMESV